jgi:hypothetical protein
MKELRREVHGMIERLRGIYQMMYESALKNVHRKDFVPEGTVSAMVLEHRIEGRLRGMPLLVLCGPRNEYYRLREKYNDLRCFIDARSDKLETLDEAFGEDGYKIVGGDISDE